MPLLSKKDGGQGFKDATTDAQQIRVWWQASPYANIGIATGASGLVVIDIDGPDGLEQFQRVAIERPLTLTAKTGRAGGFHLYYRGAVPSSQVKGEHLDVRGTTGYIVAPPSVHESGNTYAWLGEAPIAPVPAWVAPWVASRSGLGSASNIAPTASLPPMPAYLQGAKAGLSVAQRAAAAMREPYSDHQAFRLRAALAHLPPDIDGKTWFSIGGALHDLEWTINGTDQGFEIWDEYSRRSQGKGAGNGEYRGRGDLEKRWISFKKDASGPRVTVATIFAMAKEAGWNGELPVIAKPSNGLHNAHMSGADASEPSGHANGRHALPAILTAAPSHSGHAPILFPDTDKSGNPKATCSNARVALRGLGIECQHDVFHEKLILGGHPIAQWAGEFSDNAVQMLRVIVHQQFGFDPGLQNTNDAAIQECLQRSFDPVCDYLDALKWDGVKRLGRWLADYLGAEPTALNAEIGRLALVAAVRRAYQPGSKFDQIIVLEGVEGTGKSSAIEILADGANFSDQSILALDDKAQQEAMAGVWLYEIADLAGMSKAEVERVKAFASRKTDRARPAYGRSRVDRARRCIFFATTNNETYLKSQTGNRRFWPVRTGRLDLPALQRDRDQLWAEAAELEASGASAVLDNRLWGAMGEMQETRRDHDPWDDILAHVEGKLVGDEYRISSRDLFELHLRVTADRMSDTSSKRLCYAMRRIGWDGPKPLRSDGKIFKGYTRAVTAR